ncbi:MAG TPA: ABC transporter permease [Thermoanaerobaculia bacterium]|nr:ABC transporter permease [Thermoanaerobaculia bacterium]
MGNLLSDFRHALRLAFKNPGFTAVAVLTLAIGIGAATAIFSMIDAVLLRPLFKDQGELVTIWSKTPSKGEQLVEVSWLDYQDWKRGSRSFTDMALMSASDSDVTLTGSGEPIPVRARLVTANFFRLLGANAALGRVFTEEDVKENAPWTAVISHGLWQRHFGSDRNVLGKTIVADGNQQVVVGVMPPGFRLPEGVDLWSPSEPLFANEQVQPIRFMQAIARLKPGVSLDLAREDMTGLFSRLETEFPNRYKDFQPVLTPLVHEVLGDTRPALLVLLTAVGLLLLIACANVAGLLLARAVSRQKETAVRTALGAGRMRLIRQLLSESLLLALLSAALGLLFAWGGLKVLLAFGPGDIPRLDQVGIDGRVLVFAVLASLLTVLLFGLAPALQAASPNLTESLKEGGKSSAGRRSSNLRRVLVAGEVALALVLLVGAGLMIQSFLRLQRIDLGFRPDNVLTLRLSLPGVKYDTPEKWGQFFRRAVEEVDSLPGVEQAAVVLLRPLSQPIGWDYDFTIEGQTPEEQAANPISNHERSSPGYFQTLGIPLLKGRDFTWADIQGAQPVAIINESTAERFFPGQDPIGKRLRWGEPTAVEPTTPWMTIVGVVGDVRYRDLGAFRPDIYVPYLQNPYPTMDMVIRTTGDPLEMVEEVRQRIFTLDKDMPLTKVTTLEQSFSDSIARPRLRAMLLGLFAAIALLLAAVGLYGIIAYSVSQRLHEIGIRLALGADRRDVVRLIIRQGVTLTLIGLAAGLVIALAVGATGLITELLYEVKAHDLLTFALVPLVLIAVTLLASFLPARRATKVDPLVALRYE